MIPMLTMILEQQPPPLSLEEDDLPLVQAAQQNLMAFTVLYERHHVRVYRYLLGRIGNVDDAQDLTSQTFLTAMESLPSYSGKSPFVGWLFGIARHKLGDHLRSKRPLTELEENKLMDDKPSPDEAANHQLELALVARKLQTIAPDRAEVLSLRLFAGLSVAEIATMLDKKEPAIRMLVHRGLQDLQAQLQPTISSWEVGK